MMTIAFINHWIPNIVATAEEWWGRGISKRGAMREGRIVEAVKKCLKVEELWQKICVLKLHISNFENQERIFFFFQPTE